MEEKIIIDGVDVSECRFYQETLKAYNNGKISSAKGYGFCTHNIKGLNNAGCYAENFARCLNNNCYYKQLKRLEQENETLNYQWHKQSEIGDEWYKVAEKYKTALEEIKNLTVIGINASQCNCGLRALADDILQIISEVENER